MIHLEYACPNSDCPHYDVRYLVADLPMDVRYVEDGDMISCCNCESACECFEVESSV